MNKLLLCMLTWGMMITPVQAYYRVDCNGYDSNNTTDNDINNRYILQNRI